VTHLFFKCIAKKNPRGFRGSVTHLFFKVQSKKIRGGSAVCDTFIFQSAKQNNPRGVRGSVTFSFQSAEQKNPRGFRGSVTHLFYKVQRPKKKSARVPQVYHKLKNNFVTFRGGSVDLVTKWELSRTLKNTTIHK